MILKVYKIQKNEKITYNLGLLLEKLCIDGVKTGIFCNETGIAMMDNVLWTFSTNAFVPHAISDGKNDDMQPVLLSCEITKILRDVICVFNKQDLNDVLEYITKNNINNVKDVVYMTQDDNVYEDIKLKLSQMNKAISFVLFQKINNRWEKYQ